jgi:peptidoglycan-associated lipoprotein
MKRIALFLLVTLVGACSTTTPPAPTPPAPAPVKAPAPPPPPPPPAAKVEPVPPESPLQAFERLRAGVEGKSVYFAYDKDLITPEGDSVIGEHAKLASGFARDQIVLQGNCDERGGREYNLALGQRRADAVKSRLVLLGVPAAHIETVSFGKEKPRSLCHEEKCWSQNRRVDFVESWK